LPKKNSSPVQKVTPVSLCFTSVNVIEFCKIAGQAIFEKKKPGSDFFFSNRNFLYDKPLGRYLRKSKNRFS